MASDRPMTLRGQLHISRTTTSKGEDYITIRMTDRDSCVQFVSASVALADFARAITSSVVDCWLDVGGLHLVGKRREHKEVVVPISGYGTTPDQRREALRQFEVEGWKGRESDLDNHHRKVKDGIRVVMERWVEVPDGKA